MKKSVIAVSIISVLLLVGRSGAADNAVPQKQTVCPVQGGPINKALFTDYEGKRIYFCCKGCPEEFQKDPAKYISKLEQSGVVLDKTPAGKAQSAEAKPNTIEGQAHQHGGCCK